MESTAATLFTMWISSQQHIRLKSLNATGRTLWSFARYVMLMCASSVTSAVERVENQDRNLHRSKTIICCASRGKTLPSSETETLTRLRKKWSAGIQMLFDQNTNIHFTPPFRFVSGRTFTLIQIALEERRVARLPAVKKHSQTRTAVGWMRKSVSKMATAQVS